MGKVHFFLQKAPPRISFPAYAPVPPTDLMRLFPNYVGHVFSLYSVRENVVRLYFSAEPLAILLLMTI